MADTVSPKTTDQSRKTLATILRALAAVGQKPVADACGIDVATVSRMDWERFSVAITTLGFKVVEMDKIHIDHDDYKFMRKCTVARLQQEPNDGDTGIHL